MSDYSQYRGKCKEYCEKLCLEDSTLKMVRGFYFCPIWNRDQQHWWCVNEQNEIIDPTCKQFPSNGHGIYTEFNGIVTCVECGKEVPEEEATFASSYALCSYRCYGKLVGIVT